jgi:hypothetical protein
MGTQDATNTEYCGYNIAINPSSKPDEALSDAFLILEPSTNPMFTATLYEHPRDAVKTYATQGEDILITRVRYCPESCACP